MAKKSRNTKKILKEKKIKKEADKVVVSLIKSIRQNPYILEAKLKRNIISIVCSDSSSLKYDLDQIQDVYDLASDVIVLSVSNQGPYLGRKQEITFGLNEEEEEDVWS